MGNENSSLDYGKPSFLVQRVRGAYRHVAMRRAVLYKILNARLPEVNDDKVAKKLNTLRVLWAKRIKELGKAGWSAANVYKKRAYMSNCPPFGVVTGDRARCCDRSIICPFCYARGRVLIPFVRMETVLYGISGPFRVGGPGSKALPVIRPDLKIVAFRFRPKPNPYLPPLCVKNFDHHWLNFLKFKRNNSSYEFNTTGAECGTVQHQVYPVQGRLSALRSGVLLVKDGVPLRQRQHMESGGIKLKVLSATKGHLCEAFAWAYSYPRPMLYNSSPELLAFMLDNINKARMLLWFGHKPNIARINLKSYERAEMERDLKTYEQAEEDYDDYDDADGEG